MSRNQVGRRMAEKAKIICAPPSGVEIMTAEIRKTQTFQSPQIVLITLGVQNWPEIALLLTIFEINNIST